MSEADSFHAVSSTTCLCPGDMLLYECTTVGRGTTVWRGSAFMSCDYIALLHSQFDQSTYGICNNGALIGNSVRVENGSYTSQLNITISRELDKTSIECIHDNHTQLLSVGMSTLELKGNLEIKNISNRQWPSLQMHVTKFVHLIYKIMLHDHPVVINLIVIMQTIVTAFSSQCNNYSGPVPPPNEITLSLDHPGWLIFSWDEVVTGCEVVQYRIVASNCGSCPATTAYTTVVCTNIPKNSDICTFAVQTIVCDGVTGNVSDPVHALLRGTTT